MCRGRRDSVSEAVVFYSGVHGLFGSDSTD